MQYKLMMCGFSAMCEDMQEVQDRLKVIPVERAELESSACYVFDLYSAQKYEIIPTPHLSQTIPLYLTLLYFPQ